MASTSAVFSTSAVADAPAPPSTDRLATSAWALASFSPDAVTSMAEPVTVTAPSIMAWTAPPTVAEGNITETETNPREPPVASASAVLSAVALTLTDPSPAPPAVMVTTVVAPGEAAAPAGMPINACVKLSITASALAPAPAAPPAATTMRSTVASSVASAMTSNSEPMTVVASPT